MRVDGATIQQLVMGAQLYEEFAVLLRRSGLHAVACGAVSSSDGSTWQVLTSTLTAAGDA